MPLSGLDRDDSFYMGFTAPDCIMCCSFLTDVTLRGRFGAPGHSLSDGTRRAKSKLP